MNKLLDNEWIEQIEVKNAGSNLNVVGSKDVNANNEVMEDKE